jgi:hypothetical protein
MKILAITLLLLLCAADVHSQQGNISDAPADISMLKVRVRRSPVEVPYYGGKYSRGGKISPPLPKYHVVFKIKNTGTKTINVIEWHYLNGEQQACTQEWWPYESKKMLRPGKEVEITGRIMPPNAPSKETPNHRIIITRVEYTDGSVWERR